MVLVSSPHAYIPVPRSMAYNLSKAAVDQMSRTAAIELIDHRIRVNVVHPGWTDTPGERKFATEEKIQRAGASLPWKRLGRPDEMARAVVFLCDPASDYITGAELLVDGGNTLPWWAAGRHGGAEVGASGLGVRGTRGTRKRTSNSDGIASRLPFVVVLPAPSVH